MPFIPHTKTDTESMLRAIGVDELEQLFDEIPSSLRCSDVNGVPSALTEHEVGRLMRERAAMDGFNLSFLGAGAYEHHIPAAVWELTTRGEFYSSYTPYQAEASQGTLQVIYEYQTMMASLTGLEVSNASLYDGASALAEAILMAVRVNKTSKSRRILIPKSLHPHYIEVVRTITSSQAIDLVELPYDRSSGRTDFNVLQRYNNEDITAIVIPQPNFFGVLEDVDALADWAYEHGALGVAVVNPLALGLLTPPGHWGQEGVPIACGEGQPLGAPLSSGGPYFGFLTCRKSLIRQLPGRLVGRTLDADGKPGFTLTLQAREQHIRRSRATSNICTNQGLMVTAATIFMALLGPEGLRRVAALCHNRTASLVEAATLIEGVEQVFSASCFHEAVLKLPVSAEFVLDFMRDKGVLGGVPLESWFPDFDNSILVCATETKTLDDIAAYVALLRDAIEAAGARS
jgi:glycine dehydrogenase subunit 1